MNKSEIQKKLDSLESDQKFKALFGNLAIFFLLMVSLLHINTEASVNSTGPLVFILWGLTFVFIIIYFIASLAVMDIHKDAKRIIRTAIDEYIEKLPEA